MPLSVYVHVPFCQSRCSYCAFYSGEPLDLLPAFPGWVGSEAALRAPGLAGPVPTLYFGGGTPSLLAPTHVAAIVGAVDRAWGIDPLAEITLEANPSSALDLAGYRAAGVNRLSLGVQALDDALLRGLRRPHRAREALAALEAAGRTGFARVSADLLFGLPGLAPRELACWVLALHAAGAGHISVYGLEVHPGTALASSLDDGSFSLPSPDEEQRQWEALDSTLHDAGYAPYEVSNYCRPGEECLHNLAYWRASPYVGLGPGAHSFSPSRGEWGARTWNAPGLRPYSAAVSSGSLPPGGAEALTAPQALLESLFLSLRQPRPLAAHGLSRRFGLDPAVLAARLELAHRSGLLQLAGQSFAPTGAGLRRADGLALWVFEGVWPPPAPLASSRYS